MSSATNFGLISGSGSNTAPEGPHMGETEIYIRFQMDQFHTIFPDTKLQPGHLRFTTARSCETKIYVVPKSTFNS